MSEGWQITAVMTPIVVIVGGVYAAISRLFIKQIVGDKIDTMYARIEDTFVRDSTCTGRRAESAAYAAVMAKDLAQYKNQLATTLAEHANRIAVELASQHQLELNRRMAKLEAHIPFGD